MNRRAYQIATDRRAGQEPPVVGRLPSAGGGRPSAGGKPVQLRDAGSGDPAYNGHPVKVVGRLPSAGGERPSTGGQPVQSRDAGSGDPAYSGAAVAAEVVGRLPSAGGPSDPSDRPRRLHRLHRVWPDRDGNISYLITLCVDGRVRVLDNDIVFERFISFLLENPRRYDWFPRRFVVMPDHLHLIAHQGREAARLGQWIKAMKAVVGGLERRENKETNALAGDAGSGDPAYRGPIMSGAVGRLPSAGAVPTSADNHTFARAKRSWRWQEGFHDHKFRTHESEQRKWEYICLNPVRYGLVERPEQWPFGGEIFHGDRPQIIRGTPPLLEAGILIEEKDEM